MAEADNREEVAKEPTALEFAATIAAQKALEAQQAAEVAAMAAADAAAAREAAEAEADAIVASPMDAVVPSLADVFAGFTPTIEGAAKTETFATYAGTDVTGPGALEQGRVDAARAVIERIVDNVDSVIQGKHDVVELVVLALIARGHVLLEDLPGTGKTTLVSMLAKSIDCEFSRIQFTPDVMPSDVSGFSIFNQRTHDFEFRPGGVMSNLVLADEINRASAKTQSALLEAMEERQVTVDGITHPLDEPFMVLATQNPIEQFGTYPLPEAQLDRFLAKLSMGYPDFSQEVHVLELGDSAKVAVRPVATGAEVLTVREAAREVYASKMIMRYVVQIITATRDNPEVQVGSSPRGGIALLALARAFALTRKRGYVLPDDVRSLAPHVLRHRLSLAHEAKVQGRTPDDVITSILAGIVVPHYDVDEARGLKQSEGGEIFVR
jgi:MoxR-like ATPase